MKTIATIISLFALVNFSNANNIEITRTAFVAASANSNSAVVLNWIAKNESANVRYEIERSFYNNNFTTVAAFDVTVAGADVKNYSINDNAAELAGRAIAYYRVKQINANGTITYSNTMVVTLNNNNTAVNNIATAYFNSNASTNATISVKNITGTYANTFSTLVNNGNNAIEIGQNLPKGIYVVEVAVKGSVVNTQKVIVD